MGGHNQPQDSRCSKIIFYTVCCFFRLHLSTVGLLILQSASALKLHIQNIVSWLKSHLGSYFLVHGLVIVIFLVSVCLFVCAEFFSAVFDPISIKLGHMLYVWV